MSEFTSAPEPTPSSGIGGWLIALMSSLLGVTILLVAGVFSFRYGPQSVQLGMVILIPLVLLLSIRTFLSVIDTNRARAQAAILTVPVAALLVEFAILAGLRLAALLFDYHL